MTDKLGTAAEQALEVLENLHGSRLKSGLTVKTKPIADALRAALMSGTDGAEQQSAKHGEPVRTEFNRVINHAIEQGTEAWVFLRCWQQGDWSGCAEFGFEPNMAAYTAPQPAKPPPLAIWQIAAAVEQCKANVEGEFLVEFARAIERAHGINVPQARGETK